MRLETIKLGRINIRDGRFRISYFFDIETLAKSIAAVGLLSPPLVRPAGNRFVLISGWRRVLACRKAGFGQIPALVIDETDDLKVFLAVVEENRMQRALSLTEKAVILEKLMGLGLRQKAIVSDIMPAIGLPATASHLHCLIGLARAREDVRRFAHEREMPLGGLKDFLRFGDADRSRLVPLLIPLGQNKQRELLDDLWGITRRDGVTVCRVLTEGAVGETLRSPALSPLQKADRVRRLLRRSRYPALSAEEEAFAAALRKLGPARKISITPSPYFETEDIGVSFRIRNPSELRDRLSELERLASHPDIHRLFRE